VRGLFKGVALYSLSYSGTQRKDIIFLQMKNKFLVDCGLNMNGLKSVDDRVLLLSQNTAKASVEIRGLF
jgi:hypothetical protein